MEDQWLESLRKKYINTETSILQQCLLSKKEILDEIKKNQDQQFIEDEMMIKELTSKLAAMKEMLYAETQTLEQKNNELLKNKIYFEELETEKKKFLQEIKQLEEKRNSLRSAKPNLQDQQLLEQGKKKLKLYKDLTRIQWDYETLKYSIQGYVSNKCDYIHHFCYKAEEINDKLSDMLWHEIYLSTNESRIRNEDF